MGRHRKELRKAELITLQTRVDADLVLELDAEVEVAGTSRSEYVRHILEEHQAQVNQDLELI